MDKYAVIMAGGAGTRLWPLSRENMPKQFISVANNKPLIVETIERICELIPPDKCYVITNKQYTELACETLKDLIPVSNIISEPLRKNTAACISYTTLLLEKKVGKGVLAFIPADSYVRNTDDYLQCINQAFHAAESHNKIVVIGVKPTYPATGYGYIQIDPTKSSDSNRISSVIQFKEKPNIEIAKEYVQSQNYLWNSGMVVGQIPTLMSGIQEYLPEHFEKISKALEFLSEPDFDLIINNAFTQLSDISFDNGVLEKCKNLLAVKGSFDWYDIGSLDALSIAIGKDDKGNTIFGNHMGIDTNDSVIYSPHSLVTTIGLQDIIIVDTGDSILVCPKERAQDVKSIVQMLKKNGLFAI